MDPAVHRDLRPGGGRGQQHHDQLGELQVRAVRQRRADLDPDAGHSGDRDPDQPGRRGHLHLHRQPGQNIFFNGQSGASGVDAHLVNPSGSEIFYVGTAGNAGPYTLSEPGTYTLTIFGNGSTGGYAFNLLDTSAHTLTPTSTATSVSGTITPGTGTNIYRIAGTAGEQINLTSLSFSSTSGNWYLYDPNNNEIAGAGFGSQLLGDPRGDRPIRTRARGRRTRPRASATSSTSRARPPGRPRRAGLTPWRAARWPRAPRRAYVLLDPRRDFQIEQSKMESASDFDPYEGRSARGWPVLTMSRGEVIVSEDQILSTPGRGRILRRARLRAARSTSAWEPGEVRDATGTSVR